MPEKNIENFPSISEIENHIQEKALQGRPKTPWTRWVMIILSVLIFGLIMTKIIQSSLVVLPNAKGSVSGVVVNQMATPVAADIFLLQSKISTTTDINGSFLLRDIPNGSQKIIVAYDGIGHEIPVTIAAGTMINLGQIQVETTQVVPAN